MIKSRFILALAGLAAASTVVLSGCMSPSVADVKEPTSTSTSAETPTDHAAEDESPADESPESGEDVVANFDQKYTYADGTEIRFTKITTGKLTKADVEYDDDHKAGETYVKFAYKITNGSAETLDQYAYMAVTYGPDGVEADDTPYEIDVKGSPSGKILPGKSVTGEEVFMIPAKDQGDVVAQIDVAADYETAIFSGAVN